MMTRSLVLAALVLSPAAALGMPKVAAPVIAPGLMLVQDRDDATTPQVDPAMLDMRNTAASLKEAVEAHVAAIEAYTAAIEARQAARLAGNATPADMAGELAEKDLRIAELEAELEAAGIMPALRERLDRLQELVDNRDDTVADVQAMAEEKGEALQGFWERLQADASELGSQVSDAVGRELTDALAASEKHLQTLRQRLEGSEAEEGSGLELMTDGAVGDDTRIANLEETIAELRRENQRLRDQAVANQ